MIQTSTLTAEAQRVQEVAREYESRGYEVTVEPSPGELPTPLAGFRPDLVARKGDDVVVVELKARSALSDPKLRELAETVRGQLGWRFELVLLQPEAEKPGNRPWAAEDVVRSLQQVEAILADGFPEAALLLAWSAAEATLRLLARKERLTLERDDAPYLVRMLVTRGVISRPQFQNLWRVLERRNAVAHGLHPSELTPGDVEALAKSVRELLRQARARRSRGDVASEGSANR